VHAVTVLDIVLVVVLVLACVHGFRVGGLVQLCSFGGFVAGFALGVVVAAAAGPHISSVVWRLVVTLVAVVGLAVLVGTVGQVLGQWITRGVRRVHLGALDAVLGVGVAAVAVLFSAWLLGSLLSQSRYTWLNAQIQRSTILQAVDRVMPPVPSVFSRVQTFLSAEGFPSVFSQLAPPLEGSVPTPGTVQASRIAAPALGSTYKVLGNACNYTLEGTAFTVGNGLLVTNAHVVAGEHDTTVTVGGATYPVTPVLFDPSLDVAVLRTAAPLGPALQLATATVGRGTSGAVVGYPEDGAETVTPAAVAAELTAVGRDIYGSGLVTRQVYQLDARILPGNSGSPLMGADGLVLGVAFSRSTTDSGVGYALTAPEVLSEVRQARARTAAVSTGACVSG